MHTRCKAPASFREDTRSTGRSSKEAARWKIEGEPPEIEIICRIVPLILKRLASPVECWHAAAIQRSPDRAGPEFYTKACESSLEGINSTRADAPYAAGDRGLWVKVKRDQRKEFVAVGWADPESAGP